MKILVYGAGVLGSLYAARLMEAGHDVSILARGQRLADICRAGITLEDAQTGKRTETWVPAVERLAPEDDFDLVLVLVRKDQVDGALPALAANTAARSVLFMVNNPSGYASWEAAVGRERLMVGFPGAGGTRQGQVISYALVPAAFQPTTLGEPHGRVTPRLLEVARAFKDAGFPVATCSNMDAWQKTHVAWVSPLANALYMAGGDNYRLAASRDGLVMLVRGVREAHAVLRVLRVPVTPAWHLAWQYVPEPLLVALLARLLDTRQAEILVSRHANAARDEMQQLAVEFKALAQKAGVRTPVMDLLAAYVDPAFAPLPAGSALLPLHWQGVLALLAGMAGVAALARLLVPLRARASAGCDPVA